MKINTKNMVLCLFAASFLSACIGDRKQVDVEELGDTSFVNKDFKGNLVDYTSGMNACDQISEAAIAKLYDVSEDLVVIDNPVTNPARQVTDTPLCVFFLKTGASDFEWLRGSLSVEREIGKDELMGEIAEAAGSGENWEEAWSLKKSISESSEWIPGVGKAALWNPAKSTLAIKFEGYTLMVYPLKNSLNPQEKAKNRDYKKMALGMARAAGYIK